MKRSRVSKGVIIAVFLLGFALGSFSGYLYAHVAAPAENEIELTMIYSSEKQGWIEELTPLFVQWWHDNIKNYSIKVVFRPLGSSDSMINIITGSIQPVIWSPASSLWIPVLNYLWMKEYDTDEPIVKNGDWTPTVITPIVIATWENYAKEHNITGFNSLHDIAVQPNSDLKYAHTNPQLSNSGFLTVVLQLAAATGKPTKDLVLDDLINETVRKWFRELESKAVFYGSSTGFLADHAVEVGPADLNVIVVYENLVLEKNLNGDPQARWGQKLVAIYPKEGTILNDHPFAILNAPWVSSLQRWAAELFIKFVLTEDIQRLALKHGFRPSNPNVKLDLKYFNEENGVQANITVPIGQPPSDVEVLLRVPDLWSITRSQG